MPEDGSPRGASPDAPFDIGLQPERTLLAWRRTCLALGVGGLIFIRFAIHELGGIAITFGLLSLLLAATAYLTSSRRYRKVHDRLTRGGGHLSAATPVTLAAASSFVFAIACGTWVVIAAK